MCLHFVVYTLFQLCWLHDIINILSRRKNRHSHHTDELDSNLLCPGSTWWTHSVDVRQFAMNSSGRMYNHMHAKEMRMGKLASVKSKLKMVERYSTDEWFGKFVKNDN